jgi:short-subunit dehydrogenase
MKTLKERYGTWTMVTGASSGLGREFCVQLAAQGFNLVVVARRRERLEELKIILESTYLVSVEIVAADLSDRDFMRSVLEKTNDLEIGILVNCAGFVLTGLFMEHSLEKQLELLDVNCRAPLELSYRFGSQMMRRGKGAIINVASASAFLPMPFWSNYAASKSYLLHLSEGLWYELRGKGIDVLTVCPGATRTEFASVAGTNNIGMKPDVVVRKTLSSLGKPSVVPGVFNRLAVAVTRFLPRRILISMGARVVQNSRKK